jgi:hypothetical protein
MTPKMDDYDEDDEEEFGEEQFVNLNAEDSCVVCGQPGFDQCECCGGTQCSAAP